MQLNLSMSVSTFNNTGFFKQVTVYTIFLLIIMGIATAIRFYFSPSSVPLNQDALYYFWYSSDIYHLGELPRNWSPTNNGWPIFVSVFFTIFDSKDIFTLMSIQRLLSVLISILIAIPVYFLCKKFVDKKFALIGSALIVFDPRIMINSFLGITEPLFILLIASSLALFLSSNRRIVYLSFVVVAFATMVRGEGLALFLVLSIMFLIRYRQERHKTFFRYFLVLGVFILILLPISLYRIDVLGSDGIFIRGISSGENILSSLTPSQDSHALFDGLELFIKYLGWVLIPNFIIFIPLGLFLLFRDRNFEKNTIILSLCIMMLPSLYAYFILHFTETRFLYVLFPMFSVLSVLAIHKIIKRHDKSNIIIVVIISAVIVSSVLFYDYKKVDYEHYLESFEIMDKISPMIHVANPLYPESAYLVTSQTIQRWPNSYTDTRLNMTGIHLISTDNFDSLEDYLVESRDEGLTHILVDRKQIQLNPFGAALANEKYIRVDFLVDVFDNEDGYPFLKKVYDSKADGYDYYVKVFEIDYDMFLGYE